MTNDTYSGNRHIFVGAYKHIWRDVTGFHRNIPRWDNSQLEISLISCKLVCFNIIRLKTCVN